MCVDTMGAAITENREDFDGKSVMDVGAGSGILSLFAAQVQLPPPGLCAGFQLPAIGLMLLLLLCTDFVRWGIAQPA